MTAALIVTTAETTTDPEATDSRPDLNPALLPFADGTVLGRLCEQLASLGVSTVRVLARPDNAYLFRRISGVDVRESSDVADDMRAVAEAARAARSAGEPLLLLPGELLCHRESLAGLLADSRIGTGALVSTASEDAGPAGSQPLRLEHQRIVSAGSAHHRVSMPNAAFLHVLRVSEEDAEELAAAAAELAGLISGNEGPAEGGIVTDGADVPALSLVGLVRSDVYAGAKDIRDLYCCRVSNLREVERAAAALQRVDEDRVLLEAAVKSSDGLFTTYCVSPYSKFVARWAARRGLTPNAVSSISMALGVGAAACFALGSRVGLVAGALLLQVAFTADCVDGQLARYTRRFSAFGGWLDATFDRAKEYVAYAGLAIGAALSPVGSVWPLALAALALQTTRHMVDFSYAGTHPRDIATVVRRPLADPDDGMTRVPFPGSADAPVRAPRAGTTMRLGIAATDLSRRLERLSVTRWAKKVVVLPIGERFALISLTAAVFNARVTFLALLIWGGLAGVYTLAGRVLRSLARTQGARA